MPDNLLDGILLRHRSRRGSTHGGERGCGPRWQPTRTPDLSLAPFSRGARFWPQPPNGKHDSASSAQGVFRLRFYPQKKEMNTACRTLPPSTQRHAVVLRVARFLQAECGARERARGGKGAACPEARNTRTTRHVGVRSRLAIEGAVLCRCQTHFTEQDSPRANRKSSSQFISCSCGIAKSPTKRGFLHFRAPSVFVGCSQPAHSTDTVLFMCSLHCSVSDFRALPGSCGFAFPNTA